RLRARVTERFTSWKKQGLKLTLLRIREHRFNTRRKKETQELLLSKWKARYRQTTRLRRLDCAATRFMTHRALAAVYRYWSSVAQHRVWIHQTDSQADLFRLRTKSRACFVKWHAKRPDWKELYRHSHVYPLAFWGLQLGKQVFHAWKLFTANQKLCRERRTMAQEWRKEMLAKEALQRWFEVSQQLVWQAQAKSNLSEPHLRLGIKYGRRWRLLAHERRLEAAQSGPVLANSGVVLRPKELSFGTKRGLAKDRTPPRLPDFLTLPDTCNFKKQSGRGSIQPPCVSPGPAALPEKKEYPDDTFAAVFLTSTESPTKDCFRQPATDPESIEELSLELVKSSEKCRAYLENKVRLSTLDCQLDSYVMTPLSHNTGLNFRKSIRKRKSGSEGKDL
ncbi:hypothetical protein HDU91_001535, partial [Kappamyces sp. JEL0680]